MEVEQPSRDADRGGALAEQRLQMRFEASQCWRAS